MKIKPLSTATTASLTPDDIDEAQQVFVQNTNGTGRYIHTETAAGTAISTIYLQPNQSLLIRKDYDDKIFASADLSGTVAATTVLFTKTGFYA